MELEIQDQRVQNVETVERSTDLQELLINVDRGATTTKIRKPSSEAGGEIPAQDFTSFKQFLILSLRFLTRKQDANGEVRTAHNLLRLNLKVDLLNFFPKSRVRC